jgi:hypothetical protein
VRLDHLHPDLEQRVGDPVAQAVRVRIGLQTVERVHQLPAAAGRQRGEQLAHGPAQRGARVHLQQACGRLVEHDHQAVDVVHHHAVGDRGQHGAFDQLVRFRRRHIQWFGGH